MWTTVTIMMQRSEKSGFVPDSGQIKGDKRYMKKVYKTLIENFTNERLDEIAFRDKEFRSSDRKLDGALRMYNKLSLPKEDNKVVSHAFDAYAEQGAIYAAIAYRQGIIDTVQLLKKIGVL